MREGHWFHKRLVLARQWDIYLKHKFKSLRTFLPSLFCLRLETKGTKFSQKNKYRDFVVLAIPLSKAFHFKLHLRFSLHSWKPCWPSVAANYTAQKEWAQCWRCRAFALALWVLQQFYFLLWSFCTCFMVFLAAVLWNYIMPGCWPILSKLDYQKTFVK